MPHTATQAYGPRSNPPATSSGGGIDVRTLFITACASAGAAYTCSKLWAPGTLASAAFTPVIVALIKQALDKPTEVVARAVPVKGVVRSARPPGSEPLTEVRPPDGEAVGAAPASSLAYEDPATRVAQPGEIQYHASGSRMRGWRLAVVTGLLGFLIAAVVLTVPELVAGRSASDGARDTTIFGGGGKDRDSSAPATTTIETTTAPTRTVTIPPVKTVTAPPPRTVTTPPATTTQPPTTPTTTVPVPPDQPTTGTPPAAQPPG
jgi:hypothetical protein